MNYAKLINRPGIDRDRLFEVIITQQLQEFEQLLDILRQEQVNRFLEIGSRYGGSLWRIAQTLPSGARLVAVDSGEGMGGHKPLAIKSLHDCHRALRLAGYDAHVIIGDSHKVEVIAKVAKLAPFDAVFIDGDHSLAGVRQDFEVYGPMASKLVALHDVCWQQPKGYIGAPVEVPLFWQTIRDRQRSRTMDHGGNMGIGVIWK